MKPPLFCDHCRFSRFAFETGSLDLSCSLHHSIRFDIPALDSDRDAPWGWRPKAAICLDYYIDPVFIDIDPPPPPAPRPPVPFVSRPALDPPHGPTAERLPVLDLPGLLAIEHQYAEDLYHGRELAARLFAKNP